MLHRTIPCLLLVVFLAACRTTPAAPTAEPPTVEPSTAAPPSPATAAPQPSAMPQTPPTAVPSAAPVAEWAFRAKGEAFDSPVVSADGATVYLGSMDYNVYALDTATGEPRWTFETGDQVLSSPALSGGVLYVGSNDGNLYALDATNGTAVWQAPLGVIISSPAVADRRVFVGAFTVDPATGDMPAAIHALDAATGAELWQHAVAGPLISSPAVDGGVVYSGSTEGTLALDAASGEVLWQAPMVSHQSSPAVADGTVYIGSEEGTLHALDAATGEARWRFDTGETIISTPFVADGRVAFGGTDGNIYALDAATGAEIWRLATLEQVISSPIVDAGVLYIGSSNGRLYALDAATGDLEWFYQTDDGIWSSPAVDAQRVYVGSFDRNFYALSREGPQLATVPEPTPLAPQPTPMPPPDAPATAGDGQLPWWNDRTFYEVFVRSFQDSDGDGIGDFQGLIDRLDYLNDGDPATTSDLGVTGIWLMPIAQSPSYHGYDVTDYLTIEEDYGTNADFQRFLEEAHARGIAVIVDLVMNHSSNQHPWFAEARRPGSPRETWYIWDVMPDFWQNPWGGVAWHQDGLRYYFGMFWSGMPDLNYRNGEVTDEMFGIIDFWLTDMAVDGFRLDAIRHLIEDGEVQANTPETHAWLETFHRYVHQVKPDALTVGEVWDTTEAVVPYVGDEVNLAFEFDLAGAIVDSLLIRNGAPLASTWQDVLAQYPEGQFAPFLTNHDQDRVMNQLRGDEAAAKVAAGLYLTSPGVPFIYYGEEIGMFGAKPDERIRTPMQWGVNEAGGPAFTSGEPWEPLQDDWATRTVAGQDADPESLLNHYRALVQLRGAHPGLRTGTMTLVDSSSPRVFSYLRQEGDDLLLVVANLDRAPVSDYGLSTDAALPSVTAADVVYGQGTAVPPQQDAGGGFDAYAPLAELPARSVTVIALGSD